MVTTARRWDGTQWVETTIRRWDGTGWVTIHDPDPDPPTGPIPALSYSFDGTTTPTHGSAPLVLGPGSAWVPGRHGQALQAAGWGGDHALPDLPAGTWPGLTITHWYQTIETYGEDRPWAIYTPDFFAGIGILRSADQLGQLALWWGNAVSDRTTRIADLGEWVHLAVTWDGEDALIYANAAVVGWVHAPDPLGTITRINIGSGEWGPEACLIDNFRLYPVALTAQQIQDDMNTPL